MPNTAIWCGRILILIGLIGYGWGLYIGSASYTALIPAIFGLAIMICGHVAAAKENRRKLFMHLAVLFATLGFLLPLIRLVPAIPNLTLSAAVISQLAMIAVCLIFVILSVRSFAAARRAN
jgi:hypothetical protein